MKTAIKDKWLGALTSGDYEQVKGTLGMYDDDTATDAFCCLGVLCDVLLDDDEAPVELDSRHGSIITFNGGENGVLPSSVWQYVGLTASNPHYDFEIAPDDEVGHYEDGAWVYDAPFDERGGYVDLSLAGLNDEGFTFSQIADIIRWAEPAE